MSTSRTREKADGELFKSTGIDDNATSTKVTVSNTGIAVAGDVEVNFIKSNPSNVLTFKLSDNTTVGSFSNATGALILPLGVAVGGTGAANTLDDYEEGTWTPVIQNTTGTFIASEAFNYVKVGKVVTTRGYIYNGNVADASAIWQFGGLPFQPLRETYGSVAFYVVNIPADSAWVNVYANPTSSYIRLNATRDAGTNDWLQWSDVGTGHVDFHLTYLTT